jgi:Tfp pilus assembly protein PilE
LWTSGETRCVMSNGFIALIVCCAIGSILLVLLVHAYRSHAKKAAIRRAAEANQQAAEQAEVAAQQAQEQHKRRMAEEAHMAQEKQEKQHARDVAEAVQLCRAMRSLCADVSDRLARDATQSALASPMHAHWVTGMPQAQLQQRIARFQSLLHSSISAALLECEQRRDCRLLSSMVLNAPQGLLLPPSLHLYCRASIAVQATESFERFTADPAACFAAVQRECAQFAAAWCISSVAAWRQPIVRPPPTAQLEQMAFAEWSALIAAGAAPTLSSTEGVGSSGGGEEGIASAVTDPSVSLFSPSRPRAEGAAAEGAQQQQFLRAGVPTFAQLPGQAHRASLVSAPFSVPAFGYSMEGSGGGDREGEAAVSPPGGAPQHFVFSPSAPYCRKSNRTQVEQSDVHVDCGGQRCTRQATGEQRGYSCMHVRISVAALPPAHSCQCVLSHAVDRRCVACRPLCSGEHGWVARHKCPSAPTLLAPLLSVFSGPFLLCSAFEPGFILFPSFSCSDFCS